ncbi:MAG TPA: elongation factor G [Kofleriaceae bacterium]
MFPLERIRNIGIVAHVDAGKTTLTERVLLFTGLIHETGEVHDGTAHTDHHTLEQKHGITIMAAAVTADWQNHRIHLIDTPGHVDFTIEVERSLRVLDGAVVVLDGVAGVEPQTETVWRQADRHRVPRIGFVNKLDRVGADYARCLAELHKKFSVRAVAVTWPLFEDNVLVGVVDLVERTEIRWSDKAGRKFTSQPVSLFDNLVPARERLLEAAADEDPEILTALVDGRAIDPARIRAALRRGTIAGRLLPVLAGSAYKNRGVQPLLDAVVAYLPAPSDREPVKSIDGTQTRAPTRDAPLAALGFKVVFDEHGQMTFVRVYSGVLARGESVVTGRGKKLRVGRLVQLVADERVDVDQLAAGEIGAILAAPLAGGETLADAAHPIVLEAITAPEPVVRVAIEAKNAAEREKLSLALSRMIAADPSLRIESDRETGETLLAGMGQLHLDIAVERLASEHKLVVTTGKPRVAYRTTITRTARHELRYAKQTGGPGQFAQVLIEVGPAAPGSGLVFEDRIKGGAIPRPFIKAVEAGVRGAMADGLLGGHPVVDVHVVLLDGAIHEKDSKEPAFQIAGSLAFKAAAAEAGPIMLEPIMLLEVTCPEEDVGTVIGDLGRRRGEVLAHDARGNDHVVRAEVPLAESFGYANALGGMTHGRGRFVLEPARYAPVTK